MHKSNKNITQLDVAYTDEIELGSSGVREESVEL